jgi:hypothetical protein
LIIRGYNQLDSPIDASLKLIIQIKKAQLVNLNEGAIEAIPISPDGSIDLHIGGHKFVTLRLQY